MTLDLDGNSRDEEKRTPTTLRAEVDTPGNIEPIRESPLASSMRSAMHVRSSTTEPYHKKKSLPKLFHLLLLRRYAVAGIGSLRIGERRNVTGTAPSSLRTLASPGSQHVFVHSLRGSGSNQSCF